jgi:hypothetical protein
MSDTPAPRVPPAPAQPPPPQPPTASSKEPLTITTPTDKPVAMRIPSPGKPLSLVEKWERRLTSMTSLGIGIAVCLLLTLHALMLQLPKASLAQVVAAREEAAGLAQDIVDATGSQVVDQASLSNQVARAEDFLIPKRENVVGLVVEIEKLCRLSGWKPDLVVRTSSDRVQTVDGAVILPATLRLHAQPVAEGVASSFERLVSLLSQIEHFPHKVEIVSLSAVAEKESSVSSVIVELQFWTRKANDKAAAK